ncbi:unnamed protein product [Caretta caretta]
MAYPNKGNRAPVQGQVSSKAAAVALSIRKIMGSKKTGCRCATREPHPASLVGRNEHMLHSRNCTHTRRPLVQYCGETGVLLLC